jgi:hypothetical protein
MTRRAAVRASSAALVISLAIGSDTQASEPSSAPSPSPVVLGADEPFAEGGRVAFPDGGFAVTFPDDWFALVSGTRENEAILEALGTAAPELVPMVEDFLASGAGRILLGAARGSGPFTENCNLIAQAAGGYDTEEATRQTVAALEGIATVVGGPDSQAVVLPAGPAGRIDVVQRITSPDGTTLDVSQTLWVLTQDDVLYALTCTGTEPDPETWSGIAASLEILEPGP